MQSETPLEHILISSYKDGMISFMDSHPDVFEEAIELAISNKQPYSWRAAWLLWSCMEENDVRIHPYLKRIINSIENKEDGHQRELIKILSQMDLKEEDEGVLFNLCINLWEQINIKPSVRFTAFKFIVETAKKYPELKEEISFLSQNHYLETLSPGIRNSVYKMMKEISE